MAAVAGAVAIGTYLASDTARQQDTYQPSLPIGYVGIHVDREAGTPPSQDEVLAAVRPILAVTDVRPVDGIGCLADAPAGSYCDVQLVLPPARVCPYEQMQWPLPDDLRKAALADPRCNQPYGSYFGSGFATVVGDGAPLPLITGASAEDVRGATEMLRAGGVVVNDARYVEGGKVTIGYAGKTDLRKLTVPAYVLHTRVGGMSTFVSPAVAAKTGLPDRAGRLGRGDLRHARPGRHRRAQRGARRVAGQADGVRRGRRPVRGRHHGDRAGDRGGADRAGRHRGRDRARRRGRPRRPVDARGGRRRSGRTAGALAEPVRGDRGARLVARRRGRARRRLRASWPRSTGPGPTSGRCRRRTRW